MVDDSLGVANNDFQMWLVTNQWCQSILSDNKVDEEEWKRQDNF